MKKIPLSLETVRDYLKVYTLVVGFCCTFLNQAGTAQLCTCLCTHSKFASILSVVQPFPTCLNSIVAIVLNGTRIAVWLLAAVSNANLASTVQTSIRHAIHF